jgi:hypothetical protein
MNQMIISGAKCSLCTHEAGPRTICIKCLIHGGTENAEFRYFKPLPGYAINKVLNIRWDGKETIRGKLVKMEMVEE